MTQDILILGGGPAGLSTALHLARLAPELIPRILILEKAHYPRHKLCAGGLVADAETVLQRLGLDVSEVPHVDASTAHLDFAGRGLKVRRGKTHALRIIRRHEFDAWLAQKTREREIEIREGVTVKTVKLEEDHVMVETDAGVFSAQVVVGADGSNGVTRRCILPDAPLHTARLLEVLTPPNGSHPAGEAYFDFFPVPRDIAGYVWDFPTQVNGKAMRCWGIYDLNLPVTTTQRVALRDPLGEEMRRCGLDPDDYELKGHPIRWFSPENQMSVPRVLLAGDAAGADPIFGEGISIALGYGALAAQAVRQAIQSGNFSFKNYKWRALSSPLGVSLLARWLIANVMYSLKWEWFQVLLWRVLQPVVLAVAWAFVLNWGKRMR